MISVPMHQSQEDYRQPQHGQYYPVSTHDLNKGIPAAVSSGMYQPNSGVMPGAQHHQPSMGGPNPSQMVQQPTLSRMIQGYPRPAPQSMQTIPRSIGNVAQGAAQPSQQFVQNVILQQPHHHPIHQIHQQPVVYGQQVPPMYQHRAMQYHPSHYPYFVGPNMNNHQAYQSAYYQIPPITPSMNTMPVSQPTQQPKREKKIIAITNPVTGENILDNIINNTTDDNQEVGAPGKGDSSVCMEFAAQVAAVATKGTAPSYPGQSENRRDSLPIEPRGLDRMPDTELVEALSNEICDPYSNRGMRVPLTNSVVPSYPPSKEELLESNSIDESLPIIDDGKIEEYLPIPAESVEEGYTASPEDSVDEDLKPDYSLNAELQEEDSAVADAVQDQSSIVQQPLVFTNSNIVENEIASVQDAEDVVVQTGVSDTSRIPPASSDGVPESCESPDISLTSNAALKADKEGKRTSKSKKKKDLNKKGESKEGSEMDAFCIEADTEPAAAVPEPVLAPQSVPLPTSPQLPVALVSNEFVNSTTTTTTTTTVLENDVGVDDKLDVTEVASKESVPVTPEEEVMQEIEEEDDDDDSSAQKQTKYVLKYNYKEDQWSPLNPEGKKQYDRQFLLEMQSQPMSLKKPLNLPNLDVIKDQAQLHKLIDTIRTPPPMQMPPRLPSNTDIFMPQYARSGPPRPPHPGLGRRSQQGRDKPKKVIAFSSSLNQSVKLHESENAWKPGVKAETDPDDEVENQELYKKVRGILNKLTPQKFSSLVKQIKELDISTSDRLNGVIDLVFEKAIDEPNFSVSYANMCKELARLQVHLADQDGYVNFRKLLLTKCQKEFEQDRSDELLRAKKIQMINECDTEEKKKQLQEESAEEDRKNRRRQLGNIRFIGELFKLGMLTEPIMQDCLKKLLSQGDEESLECLCRLLTTIGKELESSKEQETPENITRKRDAMSANINEMQRIVDKRQTSSRVRFMLQDVIELRKRHWVPRRDDNNPKTIDQIHKEAEREAQDQQQMLQSMPFTNKRPNDDRRKSATAGRNIHDDSGWQSSKGKGSLDTSKLRSLRPDFQDNSSMQLGPGGGKGFLSWGRGSSGGNKIVPDVEKHPAIHANKFSALSDQSSNINYEGRRGSQRSAASSRESSRGRSTQLPPTMKKTPSTSKERERMLGDITKMVTAHVVEQKPESQLQAVNGKEPSSVSKTPDLSVEVVEKQTRTLIDEFLHNNDAKDTEMCVKDMTSEACRHMFVTAAINQVLERSSQARCSIGRLFNEFVKSKTISMEQYNLGFNSVLELIDDYLVDFPKVCEYLAEIIEPIVESTLNLELLKDTLKPCVPSVTGGRLMAAIVKCLAEKRHPNKVGEMWREASMQWSYFLPDNCDVSEFISSQELEFTVDAVPAKLQPPSDMPIPEIKRNLACLLKNSENNVVMDWIENHIGEKATEPPFVRVLVTAVFENAISGSGENSELHQEKAKERTNLLIQYVSHDPNSQLHALYALQALINQLYNPKGMLKTIFNSIYDDDIIGDEVFRKWASSDDPAEREGKGVALACVSSFLTWLECGDDVESEHDEG